MSGANKWTVLGRFSDFLSLPGNIWWAGTIVNFLVNAAIDLSGSEVEIPAWQGINLLGWAAGSLVGVITVVGAIYVHNAFNTNNQEDDDEEAATLNHPIKPQNLRERLAYWHWALWGADVGGHIAEGAAPFTSMLDLMLGDNISNLTKFIAYSACTLVGIFFCVPEARTCLNSLYDYILGEEEICLDEKSSNFWTNLTLIKVAMYWFPVGYFFASLLDVAIAIIGLSFLPTVLGVNLASLLLGYLIGLLPIIGQMYCEWTTNWVYQKRGLQSDGDTNASEMDKWQKFALKMSLAYLVLQNISAFTFILELFLDDSVWNKFAQLAFTWGSVLFLAIPAALVSQGENNSNRSNIRKRNDYLAMLERESSSESDGRVPPKNRYSWWDDAWGDVCAYQKMVLEAGCRQLYLEWL